MAAPPRIPITDERVLELIGNRKVLDPLSPRISWVNSRLVVLDNGSTIPLLHVIAEAAHGFWDPNEQYPVWADKHWTNESFDNTKLISKPTPRGKRPANKSGFPAGSPEYHKWHRAQTKDKQKEYSKAAYARRREAAKQVLAMKVELEELRAKLNVQEELTAPSLDFLDEYKAKHLGGGSSALVQTPPIQIGTPMDDEPYNFKPEEK
jgi:hypothetical protein